MRERNFLDYHWEHQYWTLDHLPEMTRYRVTGAVYDPESWSVVATESPPGTDG